MKCTAKVPKRKASPGIAKKTRGRTRNYPLRLHDKERAAIEAAADLYGLALSEWMREVLLHAAGRPDLAKARRLISVARVGHSAGCDLADVTGSKHPPILPRDLRGVS